MILNLVKLPWRYSYVKYVKFDSRLSMTAGSQKLSLRQHILWILLKHSWEAVLYMHSYILLQHIFKGKESPPKLFKKDSLLSSMAPLYPYICTMGKVLTLCIKQYGQFRLPILNGTEFLYKIQTFGTLCYKRYGESQLPVLINMGSIDSLL